MDLTKLLQSLGLSETESKVYLKALQREFMTAGQIAKISGVKRSTVYHTLQNLIEKGLITTSGSKVEKFKAQPAEQLISIINRKKTKIEELKNNFENALPFFPRTAPTNTHIPHVEYFHGLDSLKNLTEKMLQSKSKTIYIIGAPFKLMESLDNIYIKIFLQKRAKKEITTKSIWQDLPKDSDLLDNKKFLRDTRLAPKELREKSNTMITIVDDSVIILNFLPEMFGILITSSGYSQTMKGIWESIWKQSKKIEN